MVKRKKVIPGRIIATPFKSANLRILEKTNMTIRDLVGNAADIKRQATRRKERDKIESRPLPKRLPGAIE